MSRKHVILLRPSPAGPDQTGTFIPFGPLFLAEALAAAGYRVTLLDRSNAETIRAVAEAAGPETVCIGISTMSGVQLGNAVAVARALRHKLPAVPLVWGGVHATVLPGQTLGHELVDYLVWGEGEQSFLRLVEALAAGDLDALDGVTGGIEDPSRDHAISRIIRKDEIALGGRTRSQRH